MKKLLLLLAIPLILGCKNEIDPRHNKENYQEVEYGNEIYTINVEGHKYVIFDGIKKGGIVHAESCQCKEERK